MAPCRHTRRQARSHWSTWHPAPPLRRTCQSGTNGEKWGCALSDDTMLRVNSFGFPPCVLLAYFLPSLGLNATSPSPDKWSPSNSLCIWYPPCSTCSWGSKESGLPPWYPAQSSWSSVLITLRMKDFPCNCSQHSSEIFCFCRRMCKWSIWIEIPPNQLAISPQVPEA